MVNTSPTWEAEATRLAVLAQKGDAQAFDALYDLLAERALRTAAGILLSAQDASDAVQETFLRVWRALGQYRPAHPFAPWFYRVLINECRRALKRRKPYVDMQTIEALPAPRAAYTALEINAALAALPERQRTAISLKYLSGLSERDTARLMRTTVPAVKSLTQRAKETLREVLK